MKDSTEPLFCRASTAQEALKFAKSHGAQLVDLKFTDPRGTWRHFTMTLHEVDADAIAEGIGFDASSVRGWRAIDASDMLVMPDPKTAMIDPFNTAPTLSLICTVCDPVTRQSYNRDPRSVAIRAEAYLEELGLADKAYFGPEAEFFLFDDARFEVRQNSAHFHLDSIEAAWNSGRDECGGNLAYKIPYKQGYCPELATEAYQNIRNEMTLMLESLGVSVERQHHEVATAGQSEIDIRFNSLVAIGDDLSLFKYVVRNVAKRHGKTATFMPKPLFGDNGSGMHVHQSLWKGGKNLFAGDKYAGLSEMALYYIGGLIRHARALTAITNPTTNSYKRLVPGYEAPVNFVYSARNRSAAIRIPVYSDNPKSKRIEFRTPDPAANIYLACAAQLMAGLDGIKNKIHPGEAVDENLYDMAPERLAKIPCAPDSLQGAVRALEEDHDFLLAGDVFSRDFLETWMGMLREDYDAFRLRPHPIEFALYYDI